MKFLKILSSSGILIGFLLTMTTVARAQTDPYLGPNNTWLTIGGTVSEVTRNTFRLDYGLQSVVVEMDDGDRDADAYSLIPGDKVIVSGMIDDDFFESTSIEAASIFVEKLNATYYSSALDEEDYRTRLTWQPRTGEVLVQGRVSSIEDDVIVVDEGLRSVEVSVDSMPYNPLDDRGLQIIKEGDLVMISGTMGDTFLRDEHLQATAILKLDS